MGLLTQPYSTTQSKEIIMNDLPRYLAQVQFLLPESKDPKLVLEVEDYFSAGRSVDECVAGMKAYLSRSTIRNIPVIPPTYRKGRPPSASLAAARLMRDYGKDEALVRAVRETDKHPLGSAENVFWTDVGMSLLQDRG